MAFDGLESSKIAQLSNSGLILLLGGMLGVEGVLQVKQFLLVEF